MNDDSGYSALIFTSAVLFLVFAIAIGFGRHFAKKFDQECEAAGGHAKAMYRSTLCVTPDGRIIEL